MITRHSRQKRRQRYRLTDAELDELLVVQVCGICQVDIAVADIQIDHCHVTGRVRDVLCHNCNTGISRFHDDPDLLRRAAAYVSLHDFGENE